MNAHSLGRFLNILDYGLLSLKRKKIKNISIFLVFALVVFLFGSFQLVTGALTEIAQNVLTTGPDITVQQLSAGRQVSIATSSQEKLKNIFGIKKIDKRIWGYYFDESNGANYTVMGADRPLQEYPGDQPLQVSEGRLPKYNTPGEVVVSEDIRSALQLHDRSFFSLFRPDLSLASFKTVGVLDPSSDILTSDLILMSLADARDLFAISSDKVTDLLVYVANPNETETIAGKINDRLPGVRVLTKAQILKTYRVIFSWRSGLGAICLLTSLVAFTVLAWDKASGLSQEEMREVGILKILGWQTQDLLLLRFIESSTVSLLAFLTGYFLAWMHVVFFDGALFRPILLGWSVLRPTFELVPPFVLSDMLLIFSISVIPYLCATAIPAWRTAVVRADSVV